MTTFCYVSEKQPGSEEMKSEICYIIMLDQMAKEEDLEAAKSAIKLFLISLPVDSLFQIFYICHETEWLPKRYIGQGSLFKNDEESI